jgi:polysaccharide pyruvyl transferase WcaK-like protein
MATSAEIEFAQSRNPDATFCNQLERLLQRCAAASVAQPRNWSTQPLRPLLLGYTGKGNVGADIRVREIVRQLRVIFSHAGFEPRLVVMENATLDPVLESLEKVELSKYFPDFIESQMAQGDGVIACEGSMFTSRFSDLLSATFAGAIGYAVRQKRLAVGYGAESGQMSERLSNFVRHSCDGGLILARSRQSHEHLSSLGLNSRLGADPAWTYDPPEPVLAATRERLRELGWDGQQPIAVVCPMNPFCWPVKVDFVKARSLHERGAFADQHYDGVLFHTVPASAAESLDRYLAALKSTIGHMRGTGHFTVLVGMEKLDGKTCARLQSKLDQPIPAFVSGQYPAQEIVSVLHSANLVVTSRFHACVLSLNTRVKTIGIALDERIRNLFTENGMAQWFFRCDDEHLGEHLVNAVDRIREADLEAVHTRLVQSQIERVGTMGMTIHDEVCRVYPDFPQSPMPRHWKSFLPPLSARVQAIVHEMP